MEKKNNRQDYLYAYAKENYDRIITTYPKGTKERILATGKPLAVFIKESVEKALGEKE